MLVVGLYCQKTLLTSKEQEATLENVIPMKIEIVNKENNLY